MSKAVLSPANGSATADEFVVEFVKGIAAMEPHIPAWQRLADRALERNVFYEPWVLLPAVKALGLTEQVEFLLVHKREGSNPEPLLCGLFPFERLRRFKGMPVATLQLWRREYCCLGVPLLLKEYAIDALEAVFDRPATDDAGCSLIDFPLLPSDGPFYGVLSELIYRRRLMTYTAEQYTRAMIRPQADAEVSVVSAISSKHRKAVRRNHRLLSEIGSVEYTEFGPDSSAAEWIEEFLVLEQSGWKGQEGSALASREAHRRFFESMAGDAIRQGRWVMSALRLDGKMIAARTLLRAGGASFLFKIAYDEQYSKFSPGLLLEIEALQRTRADVGEFTDCCTAPDNTMFKRIWRDLRAIQEIVVAPPGKRSGELALSAAPLLRWVKRTLQPRRAADSGD